MIVSEASKVATESGVIATTKVIDNNCSPVLAITKFADEGKFDLIVVGTRGIGASGRCSSEAWLTALSTMRTVQF